MNDENVKRAVAELREAQRTSNSGSRQSLIQSAINLLEPPRQSQAERIAEQMEAVERFYVKKGCFPEIATMLCNVAVILREKQ